VEDEHKRVIASMEWVNLQELMHFPLYWFIILFVIRSEHSNLQSESKEKEDGRYDLGKVNEDDAKWTAQDPGVVT